MNIGKCTITIKCDVDGCHNKADKAISFDGVTAQYHLCDGCLKKLYGAIKDEYEKEKVNGKAQKR